MLRRIQNLAIFLAAAALIGCGSSGSKGLPKIGSGAQEKSGSDIKKATTASSTDVSIEDRKSEPATNPGPSGDTKIGTPDSGSSNSPPPSNSYAVQCTAVLHDIFTVVKLFAGNGAGASADEAKSSAVKSALDACNLARAQIPFGALLLCDIQMCS